jgi:hypothetical protein
MSDQQPYISTGIQLNTGSVKLEFADGERIIPGFIVDQLGGQQALTTPQFRSVARNFTWQEWAEIHFEMVAAAGVNRMVGDLVQGYMAGLRARGEELRQQHNANVGVKLEQEDSARRGRLWQWFRGNR